MQHLSKKIFKKNIVLSLIILLILAFLIIFPQKYMLISLDAIQIWYKILLPSLFPFFVFTKILTSLGYVENISTCFKKITYKLYKAPPISAYVFFMSILTGYPVGSKLCADLYNQKYISQAEAKKCITFTSNSGPMFIIGSVGIGMLISIKSAYIIYFSHILGAICNGIIYRNIKSENANINTQNKFKNVDTTLSSCVTDSIFSILLIGGIMVIAFIVIEIANSLNLFYPLITLLSKIGIPQEITTSMIDGFFEITKGCLSVSNLNLSLSYKTILSSAVISFGGISTILQAMAFLKNIVTYKFFIKQKFTHMILSTLFCVLLCLIFF